LEIACTTLYVVSYAYFLAKLLLTSNFF